MKHRISITEPYDNGRGWRNYDWLEHQTERDLTAVVVGIALVATLAIVVDYVVSYQDSIVSAVSRALGG